MSLPKGDWEETRLTQLTWQGTGKDRRVENKLFWEIQGPGRMAARKCCFSAFLNFALQVLGWWKVVKTEMERKKINVSRSIRGNIVIGNLLVLAAKMAVMQKSCLLHKLCNMQRFAHKWNYSMIWWSHRNSFVHILSETWSALISSVVPSKVFSRRLISDHRQNKDFCPR